MRALNENRPVIPRLVFWPDTVGTLDVSPIYWQISKISTCPSGSLDNRFMSHPTKWWRERWCLRNEKRFCMGTLPRELAWNLCCVSSCSTHHCLWWRTVWKGRLVGKLVLKFRKPSGVSGAPGPPARLILQYQIITFGVASKAQHIKQSCQ